MNEFDEWAHPDLVELSHLLQRRLDAVLDAEQSAAAALARRSASVFDRLMDAESQLADVAVGTIDGTTTHGQMVVAAFDHIEVATGTGMAVVPIDAIAWVMI
ncbi:MAG: hypothetical protein OEM66_06355, partial [Acidimicrobiia bacterium]|nr:hypothetical protein [Acidimicrobiia bacterium]